MAKEAFNEIQILQSCAAGDAAAFEVIVRKYQSLVCAITYSAVGQVEKSEELAQQVFINAWKGLSTLKDLDNFKAWLIAITRNVIRTFFRAQKRDIVNNAASLDEVGDTPDSSSQPEQMVISKEQEAIVHQSLERIPEMYREPMVLFYRQQQSTREVAEALDLTEETVRTRLMRGRKMLKEQVAAMIESTLSSTGPGKAFTTMVVASIAGLALTSATAEAATASSSTAAGTSTGTAATSAASSGLAALTTGITAKILTAAAFVAVGVGAVFAYKHLTKSEPSPTQPAEIAMVQDERDTVAPPESKEMLRSEVSDVITADTIQKSETQIAFLPNNPTITDVSETELVPISQTTKTPEPAEYIFEPNGILSGLVTDAKTGEPVADAEVTLSPGRLYRDKTDENGFYSFDEIDKDGDFSIGVYSKEYVGLTDYDAQPKMHLKKDSQVVKHFQLPKACMIDLYVIDEGGNPVKDARVWVSSLAEEHGIEVGKTYTSQKTNEEGYILLGGLAPSDKPYVITSTHYTEGGWIKKYGQKIRESIPDFAPGHLKITLQDPNLIEYGEIILQKGTQVQGVAKYTDGTPAKECKIVSYPEWWHSNYVPFGYKIDPNGLFTLSHIVPGTYRIQASIPTGESSSSGFTLFSAQLPLEEGKLLDVTIPRKPTEASSSGRTVKESDPKPKLHGVIVDALRGEPIKKFRLRYYRIASGHYSTEGKWTQFNTDKGDFSLDVTGSEHAICKVQVVAEGYAPQWSEEVNTENNSTLLIKLASGGSIAGIVEDAKGNPVVNAKVLPLSLSGDIKNGNEPVFVYEEGVVVTNSTGRFTLKNIAAGTETLKIAHPDYAFAIVPDIKVEEAQAVDVGKVVLNQGGVVDGILYDNQGKPQSGMTLFAQNHYGFSTSEIRHATAITDPNGFFRFESLPSEMCYIVRPRSYQHTGVVSRAIIPTNNKITRLDFGGGPVIRGQLVIDGKPLKNTRLILTLDESSADGLFRSHADTDENGRFEISAGLTGIYTLTYNQKSKIFTSNPIKLLDVTVGTKEVDLGVLPSQKRTLQVNIHASDKQRELMRYFYVRQDDPMEGACVFWREDLISSKTQYTVPIPEAGLYYAVIDYSGGTWKRYQYPIQIDEGQDFVDITLPFVQGNVTLTGVLPEQINHVWFTNQVQTVIGYLYAKKDDRTFCVEGLFSGTYYLSPKWANYQDCIEVTIPDTDEYTLDLDLATLQEKLKERVSIHVFDEHGLPAENAKVWIEEDSRSLLPASQDNYSSVFYLPDGEHTIHAEKDGIHVTKVYHLDVDKNNTASGESYETFIQLK